MRKIVMITGSSRGIGRSIALKFAAKNYDVIITSKNGGTSLQNTKKELEHSGAHVVCLQGDISDYAFCKKLVLYAIDSFGHIDVLVNNAGVSYFGLIQNMTVAEWDNIIKTNLSSVFYCCKLVIPQMLNRGGAIVNISSVWGSRGSSMESAYSASKGAVDAFTKSLAKELAPSKITVNAISCGIIDTEMNSFLSESERMSIENEIPMGRYGKPHEVAELVYHIASRQSYMTGQILTIDGGWQV